VAELAERMTAWQLNPAPILLVHRGPQAVRDLLDKAVQHAPEHDFVDRADQRHRVWPVRDDVDVQVLNAALGPSRALIADGHHRYAAYLQMQQQAAGGPGDRGLAMLVDQADTPLFLGAIHRVLLGISLEELSRACPPTATFTPVAASGAFAALSPDTLVATDGQAWATIKLALSSDRAAVEVLHDELLPPLGLTGRRVGFHHSVDEALRRIRSAHGAAVLMPALDFDLVVRVSTTGRLLPEKATSFQPKPSIGLFIRSLRDE
jgi:uncharacterized protein (DUF1015 family)